MNCDGSMVCVYVFTEIFDFLVVISFYVESTSTP